MYDINDNEISIKFHFESTVDGKSKTILYSAEDEVPALDELVSDFLTWAVAVFEWDRKDMKRKALAAVEEWEP